MNERVQVTSQGFTTQYAFGLNGQRVSSWDGIACAPTLLSANTYWNGTPVSVFDGYQSSYQHQDLLGTKRLLTGSDGSVIGASTSLPFGDGLSLAGSDSDPYHFAGLDHDAESDTEHASFRQYSSTSGRWMSPDPYDGSYDFTNPQSLNRYTYALNNPLTLVDPSGLNFCSDPSGYLVYGINTSDDCTSLGQDFHWVFSPIDPWGNSFSPDSPEPVVDGVPTIPAYSLLNGATGMLYPGGWSGTPVSGGWALAPIGPGPFVSDTSQIGGGGGAPSKPAPPKPTISQRFQKWALNKMCSTSPTNEIVQSMGDGAVSGSVTGALGGALGGGILTDGPGGVPGAALGAWVGGVVGTMNGFAEGSEMAAVCSLFHVY